MPVDTLTKAQQFRKLLSLDKSTWLGRSLVFVEDDYDQLQVILSQIHP